MFLHEGLNGVPGKVEAGPPKHLSSAVGQIVNFLGTLQNEWAGAQAFSSFDTYMAPFIRKDRLDYATVRQCMQELIYNLNVPSRWGTQTPFTNLTFDWTCPEDLREQAPIIGGREQAFTYGELQPEMDLINRAYIEIMSGGDAKGRVFTFPIPTYNMTRDFPWDSENAERLFAMTAKYGLPYFQNFINSDLKPNLIRSMCCRLQLDLRELLKRGNGLFGSAEQTGSIGVVTLNCARLGHLHRGDETALFRRVDELLDLGRNSLEIKRKVVQRLMDQGLFPFTKRYLGTLRNHFSTLGVNGINEMIRNFTADCEDISTEAGRGLAVRLLDHIRARIVGFQEETGHMYNLEATPAEGTTYRFAKEDRRRWPDILQAGTEANPYYTNSSQLPVGFTDDPFEALSLQEELQKKYTGGTVLHLYMNERLSSAAACKTLVRRALTRFGLPYITITPTFSICPQHGYLAGEHEFCPRCDDEKRAVNAIHEAFFADHRTVSVFIAGLGRVGRALVDQMRQEVQGLRERAGLRLEIDGAATSRNMLLRPAIPAASLRETVLADGVPTVLSDLVHAAIWSRRTSAVFVDCTDSEETMGFYGPLLDAGVHVVSANKRPFGGDLAIYRSIKAGRRRGRGALFHETTVGAALPVVGTLSDLVRTGDRVRRIEGALSGTLGFLMTKVADGVAFSVALKEAHDLGYTEPNPREDLSGKDVARKILILAREAGLQIQASEVKRESLLPSPEWDAMSLDEFWRRLPELDQAIEKRAQEASIDGGRLVYLASVNEGVAEVGLRRVESSSPFASLRGGDNMVAFRTDRYSESPLVVRGPGAGPDVTASGVFADIIKAASLAR